MNLRNLFYTAVCMLFTTTAIAQPPQKFNYQGVARMANGAPISGQAIGMRISILDGSASGTPVYVETHSTTTNQFGLYNVAIGGGNVVSGSIAGIAWGTGDKYVKVEIDPVGGTSYTDLGAAQLLSVPYALYSGTGVPGPAGPQGPAGAQGPAGSANMSGTTNYLVKFTGTTTGGNSSVFDNNGKVGIGTTAPKSLFYVQGSAGDTVAIGSDQFDQHSIVGISSTTSTSRITNTILGNASNSSVENHGVTGYANGSNSGTYNVGLFGIGIASGNAGNIGVYGYAGSGTFNTAIYGNAGTSAWAGYFNGNVNITGSIAKASGTFKIDHPLDPANKYLYHSFVESPDMMNVYNGNTTTDANGTAVVTLPSYFEALNKDFRYQLTAIGTFAQAIVAEKVQGNQFVIKTDKPNVEVSWQITGIRKDKYAEANRVVPEVEKEEEYKGYYLHAKEYGQPEEKGIGYKTLPEAAKKHKK